MLIKLALDAIPQSQQEDAVNKFKNTNSQILYHGLGSGKTLTSLLAGEATPGRKLVLTPASLQHNYKKEIKKFKASDKDYTLLSYEKFRKNPDKYITDIHPSMVIADEFHRAQDSQSLLSNAIRNTRYKYPKFLGLTGSVAQNDPSEIAELLHTATGKPILGNKKQFKEHFIREKIVKPSILGRLLGRKPGVIEEAKNLDKFKNLTTPYIHTFSGNEEYYSHIPKVTEEIKHVTMDKEQQNSYNYSFNKAPAWVRWKIKHNLPPSKAESLNMNAFLLGARQASNASFTSHDSPKLNTIVSDIETGIKNDKNFKGIVFSNFLESGIEPLSEKLKRHNILHGIYTGEQSQDERAQLIKDYNTGKLKILLLSSAGGEGLDLKNTKYVGLTESQWNPQKVSQMIGRSARYKSHESLPENERNVKVVKYIAEPRLGIAGKIKKFFKPTTHAIGTDEYILNRSNEKQRLNDQFTNILKGKQNDK